MKSFWQEWKSKSLGSIILERLRSWWELPETPDPWSTEEEQAVRGPDAIPVCHRCITPCNIPEWFCPCCGAAIGPYNNLMPFVRIFSRGEVLRSGVGPEAHFTPFRALAYLSIGLIEYQIFAPIYYIRLYQNYRRTAIPHEPTFDATMESLQAEHQTP